MKMDYESASLEEYLKELGIIVPKPDEIRGYLINYPDMLEPAKSLCKMACEEFAKDKNLQLTLEFYQDPKIDNIYLLLSIRKEKYKNIKNLLNRIDGVREKHYQEVDYTNLSGQILLATDCDSPLKLED